MRKMHVLLYFPDMQCGWDLNIESKVVDYVLDIVTFVNIVCFLCYVLCVACCILSVVYGVFWSCSCSGSKTECPRFLDWAACVFLLLEWSSSVALLYTASFAFLSHCSHFLVGSLSPAFGLY